MVTLILGNMICAEALPVFMDRIVSPFIAILLSVSLIFIFGEILPQAVCAKYGLLIGAHPLVRYPIIILLIVSSPLSWPMGWMLDRVLGRGGRLYSSEELTALIEIHREEGIEINIPL